MKRSSGILMPIASLPSRYGIGCLDEAAYEFVDQLEKAGQGYWQILPMGPTGYGDSPYQSFSTFAGNPYFISLSELAKKGYLSEEDLQEYEAAGDNQAVSYNVLYEKRFPLLRKAFWNSRIETSAKYIKFIEDNQDWLGDYALYMAIKDSQNGISYLEWDEDIRLRRPEAIEAYKERLAGEVNFYQFLQFEFFLQWNQLREYAGEHGVKIIGDIPIYVALDSADTWAHPELFELDEKSVRRMLFRLPASCGEILCTVGKIMKSRDTTGGSNGSGDVFSGMMWCVLTIFVGLMSFMPFRMETKQRKTAPGSRVPASAYLRH